MTSVLNTCKIFYNLFKCIFTLSTRLCACVYCYIFTCVAISNSILTSFSVNFIEFSFCYSNLNYLLSCRKLNLFEKNCFSLYLCFIIIQVLFKSKEYGCLAKLNHGDKFKICIFQFLFAEFSHFLHFCAVATSSFRFRRL